MNSVVIFEIMEINKNCDDINFSCVISADCILFYRRNNNFNRHEESAVSCLLKTNVYVSNHVYSECRFNE